MEFMNARHLRNLLLLMKMDTADLNRHALKCLASKLLGLKLKVAVHKSQRKFIGQYFIATYSPLANH